ncbi:hypothetical protein GCM10023231_07190 [Olivibacter ginsenosidimutans]|uniref:DUF3820 family protein n=1 Tax=Olivibacter ginsenosidimutans TaxID=1176537 RepID=A0ABP9AJL7_9SPHI
MEKANAILQELTSYKMPYGKYKDWPLTKLPESYLLWFHRKGFPKGKLGILLATMYEIKLNGLEYLLAPLDEKSLNK